MSQLRFFLVLTVFLLGGFAAAGSSYTAEVSMPPAETAVYKQMLAPAPDVHSIVYEVKPGDNLTRISRRLHITAEMIQRVNRLSSDKIRPGMKLKIPTYKFSAVIDKSLSTLVLKGDEEVLKTYGVATGANNSTPVGVFKITDKLVNPTWYKAGAVVPHNSPANELGSRWLGITAPGYGIHGTIHPETLGGQVTAGCVRMRNGDVEELYSYLVPGSEVTIVD